MMWKSQNKILKTTAFLLYGVILFKCMSSLFTPKWYYPDTTLKDPTSRIITGFYETSPFTLDVVFCGTSHMSYGIAPMELYDGFGIKSYNFSSASQPLPISYYLFKDFLKTQSPKVLVYDASSLFIGDSWEAAWRYPLDYMPLSKNKYEASKVFSEAYDHISLLQAMSPFYNYHTRWASLTKLDFTDFQRNRHLYTHGGFLDSELIPAPSVEEMNALAPPVSISQEMIDWLNKFRNLCDENDVEFLVTKIPSVQLPAVYGPAWTKQRSDETRQVCAENGIEFFDLLYDTVDPIDPATDFCDGGGHVNFLGTQKTSALLGDYLTSHYALDTRRVSEWDADFNTYKKVREVALLQLEYDFEAYLNRLKDLLPDKTVFISASDEMSAGLSNKDKQLLQALGIQTDFSDAYQRSFIAVIDGGLVAYEELSDKKISYAGNTSLSGSEYYLLSSNYNTGPLSEIVINGKNYSRNGRGLNIVVYDEESQTVVDSACFDTCAPSHTAYRDNASTLQYLQEYEYFAIEGKKP